MENEFIENEELTTTDTTTDSDIKSQEIQETTTDTSTSEQFYPTMEQYFLTPFLLCILIVMLFLKWCFPMKGGKSL